MRIEILGTGCPKCDLLEATAKAAAEKLGIDYEIDHVTDINELMRQGVMMTPALVVNGKVVVAGRVPRESEVMRLLGELTSLHVDRGARD
jgi:small redox-active disulfide protein 2